MGLSPPSIPRVSWCSPSHLLGSWASSPVRLPGPMALISNSFFFSEGFCVPVFLKRSLQIIPQCSGPNLSR